MFIMYLLFSGFYRPKRVIKAWQRPLARTSKRMQNVAPRDLKCSNCTINLQLLFTNLVYMASGDSYKGMYGETLDFQCQH